VGVDARALALDPGEPKGVKPAAEKAHSNRERIHHRVHKVHEGSQSKAPFWKNDDSTEPKGVKPAAEKAHSNRERIHHRVHKVHEGSQSKAPFWKNDDSTEPKGVKPPLKKPIQTENGFTTEFTKCTKVHRVRRLFGKTTTRPSRKA
jgi:hypothetical protein